MIFVTTFVNLPETWLSDLKVYSEPIVNSFMPVLLLLMGIVIAFIIIGALMGMFTEKKINIPERFENKGQGRIF